MHLYAFASSIKKRFFSKDAVIEFRKSNYSNVNYSDQFDKNTLVN